MANLGCKKRGLCEAGVAADAGSLPGAQPATEESQRELIIGGNYRGRTDYSGEIYSRMDWITAKWNCSADCKRGFEPNVLRANGVELQRGKQPNGVELQLGFEIRPIEGLFAGAHCERDIHGVPGKTVIWDGGAEDGAVDGRVVDGDKVGD